MYVRGGICMSREAYVYSEFNRASLDIHELAYSSSLTHIAYLDRIDPWMHIYMICPYAHSTFGLFAGRSRVQSTDCYLI